MKKQETVRVLAVEYVTSRRARGELNPVSAKNVRCHLEHFAAVMGDRPANRIGVADIERWMASRGKLRPATVRAQFSSVRAFCDWLVERGTIRHNPCQKVKGPRIPRSVPRALPEDVVRRILEHAPDARARLVVWLMVGLGLRCCEVASIEVGDWDRRAGVLRVVGKGGHERELPTTPEVELALVRYLDEWPATSGPLVRSYADGSSPLKAATVSVFVGQWMRDAGVKRRARDGVSAHALRHTAASDVADHCHDLRVVQAMLGHQHLATTSIYLRRAGLAEMRSAMAGRSYRASA